MVTITKFGQRIPTEIFSKMLPDYMLELEAWSWLRLILLCYYPLMYLEHAGAALMEVKSTFSHTQRYWITVFFVVVPLIYTFLCEYPVLDKELFKLVRDYVTQNYITKGSSSSLQEYPKTSTPTAHGDENQQSKERFHRPANLPAHMSSTDISIGLSSEEASQRQRTFGSNRLYNQPSWTYLIKWVFKDALLVAILCSIVPALLLRHHKHLMCLCLLVGLSARPYIKRLQTSFRPHPLITWNESSTCVVLRDGTIKEISMLQLVPGDIVHVSEGSYITADGRIVALDDTLQINESFITGKSSTDKAALGARCNATDRVFSGSAFQLVEGTGLNTLVGRRNVRSYGSPNHKDSRMLGVRDHVLENKLALDGIGFMMILICVVVIVSCRGEDTMELLQLAVGMAVAVSRSGVRSAETHRAIGGGRLAPDGCIIQRLDSIHALAGVEILCIDKLGILTENRVTVHEPYCMSGDAEEVMTIACLSSVPSIHGADPIDAAFSRALKRFPRAKAEIDRYRVLDFESFNPDTMIMQSLVESSTGARTLCVKGAPAYVLRLCVNGEENETSRTFKDNAANFARRGFRTLGIARKHESGQWELMGMVPLSDPVRSDARHSIIIAKHLGLSVKMLTGDATTIARVLAEDMGIGSTVVTLSDLAKQPRTSEAAVNLQIRKADVYAECFPQDREKILEAFQSHGYRVGTTGDDLSDGPILDQADCGIAAQGAVEAAQGSSDVLMIKPGISRIINAVRICRQAFQQEHNSIVEQAVRNIHTILAITWYLLRNGEVIPIAPLLIVAQITDLPKAFFTDHDRELYYSLTPVRWNFRKIAREVILLTTFLALGSWYVTSMNERAERTHRPGQKYQDGITGIVDDRQMAPILYISISECWLSSIIYSSGRPWLCPQYTKRNLVLVLIQAVLTTASILGLLGETYQLSAKAAYYVWTTSLCAMTASICSLAIVSNTGRIDVPDNWTDAN